jgi:hypothetical protein
VHGDHWLGDLLMNRLPWLIFFLTAATWAWAQSNYFELGNQSSTPGACPSNAQCADTPSSTANNRQVATTAFVKSVASSVLSFNNIGNPQATNTTVFYALGANASTVEANTFAPMPVAVNIKNLGVQTSVAPGAGQNYAITLRRNGADTAITCTISGAGNSACSDTSHTVAYNATDTLDVKIISSTTATGNLVASMTLQLNQQ